MPVKAGYLFLAGAGGIFIWSGVRGKPVTSVFRSLIGGENPARIPSKDTITGISTSAGGPVTGGSGKPVPGSGTPVATGANQNAVNTAILMALGAPPNQANLQSLARWEMHEFSNWPPQASFNPMASTEPEPGSTPFNSVGVQNYPNWSVGVTATVTTLNNGNYPNIIAAFRSGRGLINNPAVAGDLSTWSNGGYTSV